MKVIRKRLKERKCGNCNWKTEWFYCFEGDNTRKVGLCTRCFLDEIIVNGKMEVR